MSEAEPASFCWFDYETFGTSPQWDRPAQFAAIRTDAALEPLGEPEVIYCRQADDYLPHPAACRVTGLSPEEANARGLPEHRFIERVRAWLGAPGTCSVGYNSVRFDDEFTRHTLFRNLHEPYAHEWKDGASRWDLLDVVRLTRALRPDGIVWPTSEGGRPSNRLEDLAAANALASGRAHDALVDVRATIALARLIRERQPRLFAHALAHRGKRALAPLLEPDARPWEREPLVLVSAAIPASRHHVALVVPLVRHPENPNAVIALDLATDPSALAGLDAEAIAARTFGRGRASGHPAQAGAAPRGDGPDGAHDGAAGGTGASGADGGRLGLHAIAANKCPVVVPWRALRDVDAERLGIDRDAQLAHRDALRDVLGDGGGVDPASTGTPDLLDGASDAPLARIRRAFVRPAEDPPDVDASLYAGGFLSTADRARLDRIRAAEPAALRALDERFDDPRLDEMLFRYRARNHPDTLDADERARWRTHVAARLGAGADAPWLSRAGFEREMAAQDWRPEETALADALRRHADALCRAAGVSCPDARPRP